MSPSPLGFQLLARRIEIATDNAAVLAALRYLAHDAVQDVAPFGQVGFRVVERDQGFQVFEDGAEIGAGLDPEGVMTLIYTHAHDAAFASLPPHLRLHAGCAQVDGRRILVVGRKRAGKTTLMLRLALDGVEVQGDEMVVVAANGLSMPFPRRFHVRAKTFALLPELNGREADFPSATLPTGKRVYAIAPTELGMRWRVPWSNIDCIVFLKNNHGGETALRKIGTEDALRRLHRQTAFPERSVAWLSELLGVVKQATNYVLINGDPNVASAMIRGLPHRMPLTGD